MCKSGHAQGLLSPSTTCILGKELRSSGLAASTFLYPLSQPDSPIILSFCGFVAFSFYWASQVCHSVHVEVRGQPTGVSSLLPLCRLQGLNLDHLCDKHLYLLNHPTSPNILFIIIIVCAYLWCVHAVVPSPTLTQFLGWNMGCQACDANSPLAAPSCQPHPSVE